MPDPILSPTQICLTQYEYASGTLATTTQSCSRPIEFYYSLGIEGIAFAALFVFTIFTLSRRRRQIIKIAKK